MPPTWVLSTLTASAPNEELEVPGPTLDTLTADKLGHETLFRSLEISCEGKPEHSYSRLTTSIINPAEVEPLRSMAAFRAQIQLRKQLR